MVLGGGVGVLAADQLERVNLLPGMAVVQDQLVVFADGLPQSHRAPVVVDGLYVVGVQRARVDVGSIRQFVGVGVQQALDVRAARRVRRQRRALVRRGHEHVAVYVAAGAHLAAVKHEGRTAPGRQADREPV